MNHRYALPLLAVIGMALAIACWMKVGVVAAILAAVFSLGALLK
jgi:hypothetical protein